MQASLTRPLSNIFPQTRNSGEKKRRDRNQVAVASREQVRRCCIRTKETSFLEKGREREREPSIACRVVLQLVDKIFCWGSQTLARHPESQLFQREWPTVSLRTPSAYAMRGLRRSKEFLIDEKMGKDLLPVRSRVGMIIRARISRVALFSY